MTINIRAYILAIAASIIIGVGFYATSLALSPSPQQVGLGGTGSSTSTPSAIPVISSTTPFNYTFPGNGPTWDWTNIALKAPIEDYGGQVYNVKAYGAVGDGVTDDTAALQSAFDAAHNSITGKAKVFCASGIYKTTSPLLMYSNVSFEAVYGSCIIRPQTNFYALYLNGISTSTISGITIDGADNSISSGSTLIRMINVSNIHVTTNQFINAAGFGTFLDASATSSNVWIDHNLTTGRGNNDVIGGGPTNSTGARVENVFVDHNICVQTVNASGYQNCIDIVGAHGYSFTDNIIYGGAVFGQEQQPNLNSKIQNNIVHLAVGGTLSSIGVNVGTIASSTGDSIIISGNTLDNGYVSVFSNPTTPRFTNVHIENNIIHAPNANFASSTAAIRVVNLDGGNISGNSLYNSGGDGIWLGGTINVKVDNNLIRDSAGWGIRESNSTNSSDYNNYVNNTFLNNASGNMTTVGSHDLIIALDNDNSRIGIGTSTPSQAFEVAVKSAFDRQVTIGTTSAVSDEQLRVVRSRGEGDPTVSAGTVAVFQSNSSAGFSSAIDILAGTTGNAEIHFGDSTNDNRGNFGFDNATGKIYTTVANFGIGTSTPQQNLSVVNSGSATIQVTSLTSYGNLNSQGNLGRLSFLGGGAGDARNYIESGNATSSDNLPLRITGYQNNIGSTLTIIFSTSTFPSGIVGIGTASPTSSLFVQGVATLTPFTIASSSGSSMFQIIQNGSTTLSSLGTGCVGVTTGSLFTTPCGTTVTASGTAGNIQFSNGSSGFNASGLFQWDNPNLRLGVNSSTPIATLSVGSGQVAVPNGTNSIPAYSFGNQLNSGIYLVSAGNMGITVNGTQSVQIDTTNLFGPVSGSYMLKDVTGVSVTQPTIIPSRGNTNTGFAAGTAGQINAIVGGIEVTRWTSSGFSIGTTTNSATLFVQGTSTAPTTNLLNIASSTGTSLVTVLPSGRVGISSSTPNYLLSVNGTVAFPNLTTSAGLQTGVVCVGAGGELINDSVACLASARRFKTNIQPLIGALDEILKLQTVSYYYKPSFNGGLQSNPNYNGEFVGLIADDVQAVDPRLVTVENSDTSSSKKGQVRGLKIENIVGLLVGAMHDLEDQINKIIFRLNNHDAEIETLKVQNTKQEKELKILQQEIIQLRK